MNRRELWQRFSGILAVGALCPLSHLRPRRVPLSDERIPSLPLENPIVWQKVVHSDLPSRVRITLTRIKR